MVLKKVEVSKIFATSNFIISESDFLKTLGKFILLYKMLYYYIEIYDFKNKKRKCIQTDVYYVV